ncbi:hypothetical protein WDU94_012849 [Cyamophila willieti]
MSTLMMPAPTITTMTNPGPIPIAQHTKLEPKFVFTTNHNMAMIQQKPALENHFENLVLYPTDSGSKGTLSNVELLCKTLYRH